MLGQSGVWSRVRQPAAHGELREDKQSGEGPGALLRDLTEGRPCFSCPLEL